MRCPKCSFDSAKLEIFKVVSLPRSHPERIRWQKDPEHRRTLEFYAWFISSYKAARILDLGAGPGVVAIPISRMENVSTVVCLERDNTATAALKNLKRRENLKKIKIATAGMPWNLKYADESFDVVICRHAMHHFQDQVGTLREAFRCLKRKGILLYSDPAMPNHSRDATNGLSRIREASFHGYSTYQEMMARLKDEGFQVVAMRPFEYQRGTLNDYLKEGAPEARESLIRAWLGIDEKTKQEMQWSGKEDGPFITYPVIDIAARKPAHAR